MHPVPEQSVTEGESWTINCEAEGFPYPHYQWYKENDEMLTGEIQNTLRIPYTQ